MRASDRCIELIKGHESLQLVAYLCPAGVPTIGYGHTGPDVTRLHVAQRYRIDEQRAEGLLRFDLQEAEDAINDLVRVPLAQHEFDALVSFVFNVGRGKFASSTLLRRLNQGRKADVPEQLARWKYGGGVILPGLVRRRAEEAELWTLGRDENATPDNVDSFGAKVRRIFGV